MSESKFHKLAKQSRYSTRDHGSIFPKIQWEGRAPEHVTAGHCKNHVA